MSDTFDENPQGESSPKKAQLEKFNALRKIKKVCRTLMPANFKI